VAAFSLLFHKPHGIKDSEDCIYCILRGGIDVYSIFFDEHYLLGGRLLWREGIK
jgi:hypothetical protein